MSMSTPPTITQTRGLAYAPMPFAILSLLSSSYVIYHILWQKPLKRKRLYHRLVLAMNVAIVPLSLTYFLGAFAVPESTPYYPAASGNIQTCTAVGFLALMLSLTVPVYYGSLGLQAYLSIKHNFNEEKYRWIEVPVHLVAWCIPCAISSVVAATENFNPGGSGCSIAAYPMGCDKDPDVACERGGGISSFVLIAGVGNIFLYFMYTPSIMVAVYCLIKRLQREAEGSRGMQRVRELARKQMMANIQHQIYVYLFSFWFTYACTLIDAIHLALTGEILYNLHILADCIFASQGFVLTIVYFTLQRMSTPKVVDDLHSNPSSSPRRGPSVVDIRKNVEAKENGAISSRRSSTFSIFDGTPDQDSPWAQFFDEDDYDDDLETPNNEEVAVQNTISLSRHDL
mmetsp:Transcript_8981/g.20253  ORF Transcript_8981/g.20253 Transcript_8981/m.20253 type:complete len:399 (-) Transcript_8981:112-1308(-)